MIANKDTISLKEGSVVFTPKGDSPSELGDDISIGTIVYIINNTAWVLKENGYLWIGPLYRLSLYEESNE